MVDRYHNYHKHSHYSNIRTLDCVVKPEDYMKRAVELGHTTYFTGEHGFQGNLFEAQTLCEKYNLKPIYSVEAYYVDDIQDRSSRTSYHIMLVGMTKKARYEINKILSIANTEGFYYKPRIGLKELLSLSPEDTIVTTACVASRLFKTIEIKDKNGNVIDVDEDGWLNNFLIPIYQHFGKNFFLEVQSHKDYKQWEHNQKVMTLHMKFDIPVIHANDSHYIHEGDSYYRDLFLKAKGINYEEESGFILDYPDAETILDRYRKQGVLTPEDAEEAVRNTLVFDNAEPIYTDKEFKIPKVPNDFIWEELGTKKYSNQDSDLVLKTILAKSWKEKKKTVKKERIPEYEKAIYYETDIVERCHMADYFILDHMVVDRAVNKYGAVITRSGRGSAVSFLINNLLGLTEVDRIKAPTKLYPTRFMSAERILNAKSLPDIDLNFASVEPVIKATEDILGEDGIKYMVAYKPLQRSSAFRLWCKARGFEISEYDDIAKLFADKKNDDEEIKKKYPNWAVEIEYSKQFRGVIESIAPSPCSFLLSNDPISEIVGLIRVGDQICCCLDGYNCDVYKYLKNDYLTVKIYKIVAEVYKLIGRPIDDISTLINNCDEKVWDIYKNGLTCTINQADSDSGRQLVMRYKPHSLAEMAAWVAAIRPGFASLLNTFINREPYSTGVHELDNILKDTFCFMLYQECIMSYLIWLGMEEKYTYDIIKKISKKKFKEEELQELKEELLENWIKHTESQDGFNDTWQVVEDAAHYSFNASHALSVAIDSLYGAYLKSHYPLEYYSVVLSLYSDDMERTAKLIDELKYFNIKIEPIKFGKSGSQYTLDKENNKIYKGIASVKYCNDQIAEELLELSKNKYNNFVELLHDIHNHTSVNSRQLTILIGLDFFSDFGQNKYLMEISDLYDKFATVKQIKKDKMEEFGLTEYLMQKYAEKETAKMYKDIDNVGLITELCERLENKSMYVVDQVKFEKEYLEYVVYTNPKVHPSFYIVTDYKTYKETRKPYCVLHNIKTGEDVKARVTNVKVYEYNPFGEYSILRIDRFSLKHKKKCIDGKWQETDELENILDNYEVIR